MKKYLGLLILILCIFITGCTIDISKDNDGGNKEVIEEPDETTEENTKMESVGVSSSKDNPLSIGKVGIASKHNAVLDVYQDVDVKIVKVYDNPKEMVEKYNEENPDSVIKLNSNYKLVVLDYEVTLVNFETESFGSDILLDVAIMNEKDNNFIVNGIKQIIEVYTLKADSGVISNSSGIVTIAFEIPKDASNYLVKLGTNNHSIAYYKI